MADKSDMSESLELLMGAEKALSQLQTRMAAVKSPNQGFQAALQQVRDECEQKLSKTRIEYEAKLATLSSQNASLQREKAILIAEADQAQTQLATEDSEVYRKFVTATESYKKDICELRSSQASNMSEISQLLSQKASQEAEISQLLSQKASQEAEISQLKSTCAALSGEVERYRIEQSSPPAKQSTPQSAPRTPTKLIQTPLLIRLSDGTSATPPFPSSISRDNSSQKFRKPISDEPPALSTIKVIGSTPTGSVTSVQAPLGSSQRWARSPQGTITSLPLQGPSRTSPDWTKAALATKSAKVLGVVRQSSNVSNGSNGHGRMANRAVPLATSNGDGRMAIVATAPPARRAVFTAS